MSWKLEQTHERVPGHVGQRDNGGGLSPRALTHVFELFSQGDTQTFAPESGLHLTKPLDFAALQNFLQSADLPG